MSYTGFHTCFFVPSRGCIPRTCTGSYVDFSTESLFTEGTVYSLPLCCSNLVPSISLSLLVSANRVPNTKHVDTFLLLDNFIIYMERPARG